MSLLGKLEIKMPKMNINTAISAIKKGEDQRKKE